MRRGAGILMIIAGIALLIYFVPLLIQDGVGAYGLTYLNLAMVISAPFFVPGGVFCLRGKYWRVCFASSLLLFVVLASLTTILWLISFMFSPYHPLWWMVVPIPVAILPIVFVCLRKREWQKSQA